MAAWMAWFPLIMVFLLLYFRRKKRRRAFAARLNQKKKERRIMRELAQRFIGRDCLINLLEGTVDGVLSEVTDGGLVLQKDGKQQAVNLDYVVKIREYPYNKKGKRAALVGE